MSMNDLKHLCNAMTYICAICHHHLAIYLAALALPLSLLLFSGIAPSLSLSG